MIHEVLIFLRNLGAVALVIAVFFSIMAWAEHIYRKRALAMLRDCPAETQNLLKNPGNCVETQSISRMKYVRKSLILGVLAFALIIGSWFFHTITGGDTVDSGFILGFSIFLLLIIAVLIIRDFCRVAPWLTVYQTKALVCVPDRNGNFYVVFYDFPNTKFTAGRIAVPMTKRSEVQKGQIADIIAVKRNGRLKALDII